MSGYKNTLTIILIFLFFTFFVNSSSAANLIAWWPFSGDADDISGNSLDGNLINGASVSNGYLELDGINQYMQVLDDDIFSFGNGTSDLPFSITAWIYMDDASGFTIINKRTTNQYEWNLVTDLAQDKIRFYLYDQNPSLEYIQTYADSGITSYENQWIFVAATYDGSGNETGLNIYINGSLLATSDINTGYTAMENLGGNVRVGRAAASGTYADGKIDELRVHNYELSSPEISQLYSDLVDQYTDHEVEITAEVDPTLTLTLSATECDLGTFSSSKIVTCGYNAIVSTNATNGYISYIREGAGLVNAAADEITEVGDGAVTPIGTGSDEEYGVSTSKGSQTILQNTTGEICSDLDIDGGELGATPMPATSLTNSDKAFASASGAASSDSTEICHAAAIIGSTPAGVYSHTVTITVVGNF